MIYKGISSVTLLINISSGEYGIEFDVGPDGKNPEVIYTENETNSMKLYGVENYTSYVRDAFHRYVVNGMYFQKYCDCTRIQVKVITVLLFELGTKQY